MEKANEVMNIFYLNDEERSRYMAAGRYESDRISMIHESERKGLERGMQKGLERGIQKGRAEGLIEGRATGRAEGLAEGSRQKALETAKLMIARNYPLSEICLMTGLSQTEVEKL